MTERRWFFPSAAGALLAVALVGFARTFYLRPFFDVPPIPGYLYVHGTVLTTWFVLVFTQTCLVAAHRTDLHRRLGVVAASVALLVVLVSAFVVVQAVPRFVASGADPTEIQFVIVGDFVSLVLFVAFVASALWARYRPDWHKRLMLVASIVIVLPAVARLEGLGLAIPVPAALVLMLAVVAAHDVIASRRLHAATMWSSLVVMIALGATLVVTGSAAGRAVIDALR